MKLSEFFKHDLSNGGFQLFDKAGNVVYWEFKEGDYHFWARQEFNSKGQQTYKECSDGYWWTQEYDSNGNETVYTSSDDKYAIQLGD